MTTNAKNWKMVIEMGKTRVCTNCWLVLLKSEGRKSNEIASFLGITEQKINRWLWRYKQVGLQGLEIQEENGRPPILRSKKPNRLKKLFRNIGNGLLKIKLNWKRVWAKNFHKRLLLGSLKT